ncbi:MAG: DNA alkylation repair protein [Candidatus Micrarchaeota archaeon]
MRVGKSADEILGELRRMESPGGREGMARYGINTTKALGISVYELKRIAGGIKRDHDVALSLWKSGIHEAMMLAAFLDEPGKVTEKQMESWVKDFDSWDICDQTCAYLFDQTPFAYQKAMEWSRRDEEFVKRAGFALMCALSVHDKKAPDSKFMKFLPVIKREANDERNFVKKAVNWALRQIGKRNLALNKEAIKTANAVLSMDTKSARWIARDALRELESEKVRKRLEGMRK